MANRTIILLEATWTGTIHIGGIEATETFEVFNSGGGWSFLFGKPLLRAFRAKHDYDTDKVTIRDNNNTVTLHNNFARQALPALLAEHLPGTENHQMELNDNQDAPPTNTQQYLTDMAPKTETTSGMQTITEKSADILTRQTDPFAPLRVDYIIRSVKVGNDISAEEREKVTELLTEFADIFACSLKEVLPIPEAQVNLTIPKDVTFRTSVHQRPMNPPQCQFMNKWIDEMLSADLIEHADIPHIKHVAPTVLTQKTHDTNGGMTLIDLQQELNRQCEGAHIPAPFMKQHTMTEEQQPAMDVQKGPPKWRVMQNFAELNKATQIPPMFQGDICAKQQRLSGHRYVSVFDFASRFYAIEIPDRW